MIFFNSYHRLLTVLKATALVFLLTLSVHVNAQNQVVNLPQININGKSTIHFLSPENIQYVDISSHAIAGDLPVKNLLRIKLSPDSIKNLDMLLGGHLAVLTVVAESFIAQYNLVYSPLADEGNINPKVDILPEHTRPLDVPGITLSSQEMKGYAISLLKKKIAGTIRSSNNFGLKANLNQVYTIGDHVFLDISYFNQTNLPYTIDEQRFKIEDKKITKASNVQSVEIKPLWQLYPRSSFKKQYRNIYVLKKLTYPGSKVLNIELTEKQISGRALSLQIKYSDILEADTF
jgi:conjugative transposon TraN protein